MWILKNSVCSNRHISCEYVLCVTVSPPRDTLTLKLYSATSGHLALILTMSCQKSQLSVEAMDLFWNQAPNNFFVDVDDSYSAADAEYMW